MFPGSKAPGAELREVKGPARASVRAPSLRYQTRSRNLKGTPGVEVGNDFEQI